MLTSIYREVNQIKSNLEKLDSEMTTDIDLHEIYDGLYKISGKILDEVLNQKFLKENKK